MTACEVSATTKYLNFIDSHRAAGYVIPVIVRGKSTGPRNEVNRRISHSGNVFWGIVMFIYHMPYHI